MRHRLFSSVLVLLIAAPAVAADPAADALISRGLELRRQGQSAEALELFKRAHALDPTPRTFGQMGLVETSLQHWLEADAHLRASLEVPSDPWVKKTRELLDKALQVTGQHFGELVISGPAGATVSLGDSGPKTLPLPAPLRLLEGDVRVSATAPGFKPLTRVVRVEARARASIELALQPVETAARDLPPALTAPIPPPAVPAERPTPGWVPWTVGGLVVAGAVAGIWGGSWVAVDGNSSCGSMPGCDAVYDTKTPGLILVGAGVAAAATGIVLWLTNR